MLICNEIYFKNIFNMINAKIRSVREILKNNNWDAVIVPTADAHQSEYVPECWKDREWLSGFTGSAGLAIVTNNEATLWTDSRYFIQAEEELSSNEFVLKKQLKRYEPEHLIWLTEVLENGSSVVINSWNFTAAQEKQIKKIFKPHDITVVYADIVSQIWDDRPQVSIEPIFEHSQVYHGTSRQDKIEQVRSIMRDGGAEYYIVTALDEIAWVLNLRGKDSDFNPIFISYLIIAEERCHLFIDDVKIGNELQEKLKSEGILLAGYGEISEFMNSLSSQASFMCDPSIINHALYGLITGKIIETVSPIQHAKGVKNKHELAQWESAMIKDGVALTRAFYWLENVLEERGVTEVEFGDKIAAFRSEEKDYFCESFPAIVGYNGNGAIIHYRAQEETCKTILKEGVLLCDSGAQYLDGTTDITRTIALGEPTQELKEHYTLVLKGMIALSRAHFPKGTSGATLDVLAREPLWNKGLNYPHGTGHGVGFFLNVHEGPHGFAPASTSRGRLPLEEGMIISNEPGYYIDDQYGIRIENLVAVETSEHDGFYRFKTLTLMPIDQKLMDETVLNSGEKAWINTYHNRVFESLSPYLEQDVRDWLWRKCKPLN